MGYKLLVNGVYWGDITPWSQPLDPRFVFPATWFFFSGPAALVVKMFFFRWTRLGWKTLPKAFWNGRSCLGLLRKVCPKKVITLQETNHLTYSTLGKGNLSSKVPICGEVIKWDIKQAASVWRKFGDFPYKSAIIRVGKNNDPCNRTVNLIFITH